MKKIFVLFMLFVLNACTTKYILMEDTQQTGNSNYYYNDNVVASNERMVTGNDVFPVEEGATYVTYQYKNVRVDEISPLASLYCADVVEGASPYLREVNMFHNGFMQATFDCVNIAI